MNRLKRDNRREKRIDMDILVDARDEEERAMGWYYYLTDTITFPFKAQCVSTHPASSLKEEEFVEVTGMAPEFECLREMFVESQWDGQDAMVPLAQLRGVSVDKETQEALEDWHYWVGRGYGF
ncbi:calcium-binding protein [candidate division KSB3 bacterium]|uniref:Calcium-binding protein n=1 Tax=candidate division KSB3 bacterium TaxID=2044937 RepID=A0A2G6KLL2_9BACT|nr:MAG: calcium-binding protein [candidate division KSB3 bacterium]